jgi:benzoyl-CoA reductase/2-hydroxyglutaryl-CoA dehydratase subunit BcrC/BadD/HgdB
MNNSLDPKFPHFRFLLPIKRGGKTETKYYYKELKRLISWFEDWIGKDITYDQLFDAIKLHNFKRMALKEISQFVHKSGKDKFTMAEFVKIKLVTDILPVVESTNILQSLLEALRGKDSEEDKLNSSPRILISGSMFDNYRLFDSIDILNKTSVATVLSFISRSSDFQVILPEQSNNDEIDDLLLNLASAYIVDKIPDSVHHYPGRRRDHLVKQISDYKIDGVIFIHYSFCDPDAFESRSLSNYLETKKGIPTITIVTDPQLTNLNQMTTRVEAFLEKIGDT